METIKEVKQGFADEHYTGIYENDFDSTDGINKAKESYIEDIECCDPDGERENLCREIGYVEGYAQALRSIKYQIESSNNKLITSDAIDYYLNN